MNLELINLKLEIMRTLNMIGYEKEIIAIILYRIEYYNEDIGEALWKNLLDIQESQKNEQKDA